MSDPVSEPLSPAGLDRKETMLDELCAAVRETHRARRRRRRFVAAGGSFCLILALAWLGWSVSVIPSDGGMIAKVPITDRHSHEVLTVPRPSIIRVATDPTVLERYRARSTAVVERIDDRILLNTLASIGRPAGLIRYGGRIRLTAAVTDVELSVRQ
ncbi:MAG: hypothetical protein GY842_08110 [bacterium]|nr:hypothetical protein [bacterium]